jgi:DNA-binding NtrC family response regulator
MDVAQDILVVEADASVRAGLAALLREAGLEVTAVGEHARAQDQLANRFYAAMLVELDGPSPKAGIDLVNFARERSPLTRVIVLSARRTFEAVAAAFRAGAFDVIPKTQEHLPYLRTRVLEALQIQRGERNRGRLLHDMAELHERFLSQMVTLFQKVTELEARLVEAQGEGEAPADADAVDLLVVDDDPALATLVGQRLASPGWKVRAAGSGGSALDAASQQRPHIFLIKDPLPDLPTSMLVKTLVTGGPEMAVLIYHPPSLYASGEVIRVEGEKSSVLIPRFDRPEQLLAALTELKDDLAQVRRERRQLAAFRAQHADFLKLYAGLKQRLAAEDSTRKR